MKVEITGGKRAELQDRVKHYYYDNHDLNGLLDG